MSLLLGVHAERKGAAGAASAADAHEHLKAVALTGVAGLLAGAASMACGEWCVASASPHGCELGPTPCFATNHV